MAEIQILSDLMLGGALIMGSNETGFPLNPRIGTFIIKDQCLYGYIKIGNLETWYPFASKTNSYIHTQGIANLVWTVNHNLGTSNIWIQVKDNAGNIINVSKTDINDNSFTLNFTAATKGTVVVVAPDSVQVPQMKASVLNVAGDSVIIDDSGIKIFGSPVLTSANIALAAAEAVQAEQDRAIAAENLKADKATTYTKTEVNTALNTITNALGTASSKNIATSGNASATEVVMGNDSRLTDSRLAKDVYAWAKTPTKPVYNASEIVGLSAVTGGVSSYNDLTNKPVLGTASHKDVAVSGDASATEVVMGNDSRLYDARVAGDVYAWAKTPTKPAYNTSELTNDAGFINSAGTATTPVVGALTSLIDYIIKFNNNSQLIINAYNLLTDGITDNTLDFAALDEYINRGSNNPGAMSFGLVAPVISSNGGTGAMATLLKNNSVPGTFFVVPGADYTHSDNSVYTYTGSGYTEGEILQLDFSQRPGLENKVFKFKADTGAVGIIPSSLKINSLDINAAGIMTATLQDNTSIIINPPIDFSVYALKNDVPTSYNALTDKPTLSIIASTGSYNDLIDKPTLSPVASTGSFNDLTNLPVLDNIIRQFTGVLQDLPNYLDGRLNTFYDYVYAYGNNQSKLMSVLGELSNQYPSNLTAEEYSAVYNYPKGFPLKNDNSGAKVTLSNFNNALLIIPGLDGSSYDTYPGSGFTDGQELELDFTGTPLEGKSFKFLADTGNIGTNNNDIVTIAALELVAGGFLKAHLDNGKSTLIRSPIDLQNYVIRSELKTQLDTYTKNYISYNNLNDKPTLGTAAAKDIATTGNASATQVVMGNDTRLSDARNAADVYAWAKESTKPTYTADEVNAASINGSSANDFTINNLNIYGSILPATTSLLDIGSPTQRFKTIYVDEAKLSTNTLYIGDTPILGTSQDTIMIKADPNQSINMRTLGTGITQITSVKQVNIESTGLNGDVVIQASGVGSKSRMAATQAVEFTAPTVDIFGNSTISGNQSVSGNVTITGNLTVNGNNTIVNSTTVTTKDNIIVVNSGEIGTGVTSGKAGLQIDRGDEADYQFLFDETDDMFKVGMVGQLETVATRPWVSTNYAPATHNHNLTIGDGTSAQITYNNTERLDIVGGANVSIGYDDVLNKITISTSGTISGNVDTATKLATARTISSTGDVLWTSTSFDGSSNVTGVATLANSGITAGTYNGITFNQKGLATNATNLIDTNTNAWVYNSSFYSGAQDTEPRGVTFDTTGTIMYIIGNATNTVYQYTLSTPWSVATAVYSSKSLITTTQEGTPLDLALSSDGTKLFIIGSLNTLFVYTLSTPWDISTGTYSSISLLVSAQDTGSSALTFNTDGTKMYIGGGTNDKVYEYTLSTPWDIATAVYTTNTIALTGIEGSVQGISFNSTGTKLYVTGSDYAQINEFTLSTPWVLTSAIFSGVTSIGLLSTYSLTAPSGIFVNLEQNKVWVTDYNSDRVFELSTNKVATRLSTDKVVLDSDVESKYNLTVNKNLRVNGSLIAPFTTATLSAVNTGSLTASSGVTMSTTTGTISIGTSQTTGATIIGATAQTGGITIGRSTAAQTIAIAAGANTSGVTKTVTIGAAGVSGSITNIAIGSAVAGATGSVTVYQPLTHYGITPTAGTNIDQIYSATDSLTLTTTWQDTSVNGAELATGTYIVQVFANDTTNGGHYNTYYSGIMSWYGADTNETSSDEITLHRAGHASNTGAIYLRVLRTVSADVSDLKLQIAGNTNNTAASSYTYKFRRMI